MNNDEPQPENNKPKYKGKYRIDSTRLPAWNYASDGGYFITICTDGKKYFFGEVCRVKCSDRQLEKLLRNCGTRFLIIFLIAG
ncbi:MAG: hypothetical protein V7K27_35080 [Nostoc sp.]|uniref:hypothetical protein n=1 Tax=Nostoc sp. TaxID=1180 RepID=UPI002FF5E8CF